MVIGWHQSSVGIRQTRHFQSCGQGRTGPKLLQPNNVCRKPLEYARRKVDLAIVNFMIPAIGITINRLSRQLKV